MDSTRYNVSLLQNASTNNETFMSLSTSAQVERGFKLFFVIVVALANTVGNSGICLVAFRDPHLRVIARNYVVASLALSDLLAVQIMIFRALTYYNIGREPFVCSLMGRIFGCLLYVSTLHLFILSIDRYIAIFYPLRYRFLVTPRRIVIVLLTIWIVPVLSIHIIPAAIKELHGYPTFYGCIEEGFIEASDENNRFHLCFNVALLFFFPLFAMMVAYYRISKVAWYQSNRVGVAVVSVVPVANIRLPRSRERKWAKTLAIVIGAFLCCYLPIVVASLVYTFAGGKANNALEKTLEVLILLTFLNTVLNPVIYSLRSHEYRRALKKMCGRCFEDSNNNGLSHINFIPKDLESQTVSTLVNTQSLRKDSISY